MIRPGAILGAAVALFVLSFAALYLWAAPVVRAGAAGYEIPDVLLEGYPIAYVRGFVEGLNPEARAAFLGPYRWLDSLLQVSLTLALALATYLTARRWSVVAATVLALVPLGYFAADVLENAQLAAMVRLGSATDAMARAASGYTVLKGQALRVAVAVPVFLGTLWAIDVLLMKGRRDGLHGGG